MAHYQAGIVIQTLMKINIVIIIFNVTIIIIIIIIIIIVVQKVLVAW